MTLSQNLGKVVVVGGDAAGMSAASRLLRISPKSDVTVFERESTVSYAACGMPYHLDGRIPDASTLLVRSISQFTEAGVDVQIRHEVTELDTDARKIVVRSQGQDRVEDYDSLLIATGATAVMPELPGIEASNVFAFRRYSDMLALVGFLDQHRPARIAVVGGGYIGVELADVLTARGQVRIYEAADSLLPETLDPEMSRAVVTELRGHGVEISLGQKVLGLETNSAGDVMAVRVGDTIHDCDVVIVSIGVRPASEIARAAGIVLGPAGAIATDANMRTNVDGVWAAGDCASTRNLVTGKSTWVPLGPLANKQGRAAADSIANLPTKAPGVVGTALVKAFDLEIGRTGLTATQAHLEGFDVLSARIESTDRAHYYPGAEKTTILLHSDRESRRLLGGQIIGYSGVAGRTNVIATALQAGMEIDDFAALDLGYAPPFSPVWDPILLAAQSLIRNAQ